MITILPMKDENRKEEILRNYPEKDGLCDVLVMGEKEELLGTAVLCVADKTMRLLDLSVSGQVLTSLDPMGKMVADSLMRAAASYGENHGAEQISLEVPELDSFWASKGFAEKDGCRVAPMEHIVHTKKPEK